MRTETLEIKFGTSRGRETYGYNLVTLYVRGKRVARTCGGGYDMAGTVLGDYIEAQFQEALMKIHGRANHTYDEINGTERREGAHLLYSMTAYYNGRKLEKIVLDGACGVSSVQKVAEAIGLKLRSTWVADKHVDIYLLDIPARLDK